MTISHIGAAPERPLSAAVRAGDWLYISGQASTDPVTGTFLPGSFAEEFSRSVENLWRVLASAGGRPEQLVKVVSYLRDEADLPHYNDLYRAAFTHPRPARTTTQVGFQFLRFEIEAVAYLGP